MLGFFARYSHWNKLADGEVLFLLTWNSVNICSMFGKPQGWFINYVPRGIHQL